MSKQVTRQNPKQNRPQNKQGTQQTARQNRPQNKQNTQQSARQGQSADKQITHQATRQDRRREEQLRREEEQRRAARTKRFTLVSILVAVVLLATGITAYLLYNARNSANHSAQSQSEQIVNAAYPPIDNIYCDQLEQTAFHIHAHLSIYINGQPVQVAQNIGIAADQSCFYWLHTHNTDGIIHIEAPAQRTFTLGNFLDIWGGSQFAKLNYPGPLDVTDGWTVYVNGKLYKGDFHNILLDRHELITMAYNSPKAVPDTTYSWGSL